MLEFGIVSSIDRESGFVKVIFSERNNSVLNLPIIEFAEFPNVREQVACIFKNGSTSGVCLGRLYSKKHKPKPKIIEWSECPRWNR